jgi:hypothetical protein
MSNYAKIDGLAEFVYGLREAGTPWDKEGGIVTQVQAKFPAYKTKSAIPLRKLYNGYKATQDAEFKVRPTKKAVTELRDGGAGWDHIAQRTGKTVAEVKSLYTGEHGTKGRLYVSADGTANLKLEATTKKAPEQPEIHFAPGFMG